MCLNILVCVCHFHPADRRVCPQLGVFAYYTIITGEMNVPGPVAVDSPFIYRPDKRQQVWRFIFYAYLHMG